MHAHLNTENPQCVKASKLEFSKKCRRVSIKNIPCGVSTQDILELLKPYFYQQIHIDKNSQSCKAVLLDGNSATRCIDQLNGKKYRGQNLCVSIASCDFMLCITQLPRSYTHGQFLSLITPFGTPERCFLVYSEITGESKGYGCVEFTSKESSIKAKNQLNGYKIDNNTLQVHWLDTIPATYSGLSSICLLVEDLPVRFNDCAALKRIFSCHTLPKFCQVASCCSGEFAVVEFQNSVDCEKTWSSLDGYKIGNACIKVSFCVPGPCGLVVLNSLKASRDLKSANPAGGLLPTPVLEPKVSASYPAMFQNKHGKDANLPPCAVEDVQMNGADIRVQLLINSLHGHSIEKQASGQVPDYGGWSQNAHNTFNQRSQKPVELRKSHPTTYPNSSAAIHAGNIACDGGKVDDEVFEVGRRSKEETHSISHMQEEQRGNNYEHHHFHPHAGAHASLMFLREDSQRSDSSDSAYGGSQGSNSEAPCHLSKDMLLAGSSGCMQHNDPTRDAATVYSMRSHVSESYARKFHHPSHVLDRNPPATEWERHGCARDAYQSTSSLPPSGRFSPYKIQNAKTQQLIAANYAKPPAGLPQRAPSAFGVYPHPGGPMMTPRGASGVTSSKKTHLIDRGDSEIVRLASMSRSPIGPHLGVDSPTQLRLLGSNLMEGLQGDSPRSTGDEERERRLDALNLLSSPSHATCRACTPVRRDHLLPSPEPSPEAGAYVGQHSQGIGGHYADSYRRFMGPQSPFSSILIRRRKSNEI